MAGISGSWQKLIKGWGRKRVACPFEFIIRKEANATENLHNLQNNFSYNIVSPISLQNKAPTGKKMRMKSSSVVLKSPLYLSFRILSKGKDRFSMDALFVFISFNPYSFRSLNFRLHNSGYSVNAREGNLEIM